MSQEGITMKQAASMIGATIHQVRYWSEIGLVKASVREPAGHCGIIRRFTAEEVEQLRQIAERRRAGVPLQRIVPTRSFRRTKSYRNALTA